MDTDFGRAALAARVALPSRETDSKGDVWVWSKEKAQHESRIGGAPPREHCWLVHGKWYDLTTFVDAHPGGASWLRLTAGQDVTEAFEVHHLNTRKAEAVLAKYYVGDADAAYAGRYVWDERGFFRTVKRRVAAHFSARGADGLPATGPTRFFVALCCFAIAVHFCAFGLLVACPCAAAAVLAGLTLQAFHGIGHNALHMKDNGWMYLYDFCGWKHHKHRVSHALSHHLHPNTVLDLEHPEPWSFVATANAHRNSRWVILVGPLIA
jgi:hypothetical protein